jgi:hypothetical protein
MSISQFGDFMERFSGAPREGILEWPANLHCSRTAIWEPEGRQLF